ncbi:hypothetical protein [Bradyrhizobium sp. DASA03120]|uniref:hypothetical protein n=1 Tax=Bradyrhizobium sp. SMVTL-02 TaxID=3395917 RepID=UPI003F6FB2A5
MVGKVLSVRPTIDASAKLYETRLGARRFSEEIADRLARLAWWDWDHDKLREALPHFRKLGIEDFLAAYEARANSPRSSKKSAIA